MVAKVGVVPRHCEKTVLPLSEANLLSLESCPVSGLGEHTG